MSRRIRNLGIDAIDRALPKGTARRDLARRTLFRLGVSDVARDIRNPFGSTRDAQYQTWLRWNSYRSLRACPKNGPLFSAIVVGSRPEQTLEDLASQSYERWEGLVCGPLTKRSSTIATNRFRVVDESENSRLQKCLLASNGEYFIVLRGGDRIAIDAFEMAAEFNAKDPSLDVIYTDSDQIKENGRRVRPFFKPDWSPRLLREMNYVGLSCFFKTSVARKVGGLQDREPWNAVYDLLLRLADKGVNVGHIARPVYSVSGPHGYYRARRRPREETRGHPLVTIITITHDRLDLLRACIRSIELKTTYKNYEILVVDHKSQDPRTRKYLSSLHHKVIKYDGSFNFSKINNLAADKARGDYIVFMNDDIEVLEPNWIQAMLQEAQREGVGMVGPLLLYPNGRIQHCGIVVGIGIVAGHIFRYTKPQNENYWRLHTVTRECSAVTAACAMIRKSTFLSEGGFEEHLATDFNDVDLCLRLRKRGYATIITPNARMLHRESSTRGHRQHSRADQTFFVNRWQDYLCKGDPYYNNNLTMLWDNAAIGPVGHRFAALALLLELYAMRKDLQTRFPEARDGTQLPGILQWATTAGMKDKTAARFLLPRLESYQAFLGAET